MNISSVNSNPGHSPSQQLSHRANDNTLAKKGLSEHIAPVRTEQMAASSTTAEKTSQLDLENITPKETYDLAVNLLESESISLNSYVQLMAIGLNQEYPPGQQVDKSNPASAPFNLLNELDSIASGTHEYFTSGVESDKEEAKSLFDLLSELPQKMLQTKYTPIDLNV